MMGLIVLVIGITPAFAQMDSPLQQYKSGIPMHEIQCEGSKILMESPRNQPACISESSIERLQNIGYEMVSTTAIELKESLSVNENNSIEKSEQSVFEIQPTQGIANLETSESKPILNPSIKQLKNIIPQDIVFDYVLETPGNHTHLSQKLASYSDDKILKVAHDYETSIRYDTQKGDIFIDKDYRKMNLKYTFFGKDRINPNLSEDYTLGLLKELGIVLDSTVVVNQDPPNSSSSYTYWLYQEKDGLMVVSNQIKTKFDAGYSFVYLGNWNDNLDEMNLVDIKQAKQDAAQYLLTYDELTHPDCDVRVDSTITIDDTIAIIHGRPLYALTVGECQTPIWDGHYDWFDVYVDALTGKPLYAQNKPVF